MKWCSVLCSLLFMWCCTSVEKSHDIDDPVFSPEKHLVEDTDQVCTNLSFEIGYVLCKEIYLTPCGVTLRQCSEGSSYYCLHDVVCKPKAEANLEEEIFDLEEGTQSQR